MSSVTSIFSQVGNSLYTVQQAVLSSVVKLKELRGDAECYQKVCQIAYASFQLMMINHPAPAFFANLSNVVSAVCMHDFYRIVKQPRSFFFPVTAKTIDENKVLQDITKVLSRKEQPASPAESSSIDLESRYTFGNEVVVLSEEDNLKNQIKECLVEQLELMDQSDTPYRNVSEFLEKVIERLVAKDIVAEDIDPEDIVKKKLPHLTIADFSNANSSWLRRSPPLEKVMNITWGIVDIMTPAFILKEWKLLDTAKYAEQLGQVRGFQWVKNQSVEVCLIGGVCAGYTLKILESSRKLIFDTLTEQEGKQARWNVYTSIAELAFFGSIFMNLIGKTKINNVHIQLLALTAKSLGLLNIVIRRQYEFFQTA